MALTLLNGNPNNVTNFTPSMSAGTIGAYSGANGISQCYAPVTFGGAQYVCWQATGNPGAFTPVGGIFVSQSTDGGNTWAILDQAHSPTRNPSDSLEPDGGVFFDGGHLITVCYSVTADPITPVSGPMQFQDFDLSTGLWSAVYGTSGAPNCLIIQALYKRAAGDMLVLFTNALTGVSAVSFSAGSWGAPFSVTTHSGAGIPVAGSASAIDATGAIHVFGINNTSPGQQLWYQRITPANALGSFTSAIQSVATGNLNGSGLNRQVAIGNGYVALGTNTTPGVTGDAAVIYGTPLNAPVFTITGAIDPGAPITSAQTANSILVYTGGIFYAVYYTIDPISDAWTIRAMQGSASPAGPYSAAVTATQGGSGPYLPSQIGAGVFGSTLAVMASFYPNTGGPQFPAQSMITYSLGAPAPPGLGPIINPYSIQALPLPFPTKCR